MVGGVAASMVVKTLTDVTKSNVRADLADIDATRERVRVIPTAQQRAESTNIRLDRNQSEIDAAQQLTRGVPRGALVDLQA